MRTSPRRQAVPSRPGNFPSKKVRYCRPTLEHLEGRALPAVASFQMRLEQAGFAPLTIADGGPLDANPTPGVITFNGSYGTFFLNVISPLSKPIVGNPNLAAMELSSVNATTAAGGTLLITTVDTDFTAPAAAGNPLTLLSAVGTTVNASAGSWLSYQSWANADNASPLLGSTTVPPNSTTPGLLGPLGPGASDATATTSFIRGAGPFSLFQQAQVRIVGAGSITFGASTQVSSNNQPLGTIGDFVWEDVNANGVQDQGEPGVADVTVRLLDSGGALLATTTTDASGHYRFSQLPAGTYRVQFVRPQHLVFTRSGLGGDDTRDSDGDFFTGLTAPVTLAAGESNLTIDQGLLRPQIVNSTRDLPDSDLNDGIAWTGFLNTAGRPENTLRSAIQQANHNGGFQVILFDIPQSELGWDGQVFRIAESNLPAVTTPTFINGESQREFNTPKNPVIVVNGSGLVLRAGESIVKALAILNAPGLNAGITIENKGGNHLEGNLLGLDPNGAMAGNGQGVLIKGTAANKVIGNVISGNSFQGLRLEQGAKDNIIQGNLIGTDRDGKVARPNGTSGVEINRGTDNLVGTDGDGNNDETEANVISGNGGNGVTILGDNTSGNRIAGNLIGTNQQGTAKLGNVGNGVMIIAGASKNFIGTNSDGKGDAREGNVISGNKEDGVLLFDEGENVVAGNLIGTNKAGDGPLGNGRHGVNLQGNRHRIGTNADGVSDEEERNVISGNQFMGVNIAGHKNVVAGNYIGLDRKGAKALANGKDGVLLVAGAKENRVGVNGADANALAGANVISGNKHNGVRISGKGTNLNWVSGNLIGTDATGTEARPNERDGVLIEEGAQGNLVGTNSDGSDNSEGNLISGNKHNGVRISGKGSSGNRVAANFIGTDVLGFAALGNEKDGVRLEKGAQANFVGTNSDGKQDALEGNVISGNKLNGVRITGDNTNDNKVAGNYLGTDVTGMDKLPNEENGVLLEEGAQGNILGVDGKAANPAAGKNVLSGNQHHGVLITGKGTNKNVVAGNYIGTDVRGDVVLPNEKDGVRIEAKARLNWVGTNGDGHGDALEGNTISGNKLNGVRISGDGTNENKVSGNKIGTDAAGKEARPNEHSGVLIEAGAQQTLVGTNSDGVSDVQERNLISGNKHNGVRISGANTEQHTVAGNYIGTKEDGLGKLGNLKEGVRIENGASKNRIGSDGDGTRDDVEGNVIAFNGPVEGTDKEKLAGHGIVVESGTSNTLRFNSIFSNTGRGIDLGADSFTINDRGDGDSGANNLQNYPVLMKLDLSKAQPVQTWQLTGKVGGEYFIDFYANDEFDPSGFGEGKRYLLTRKITLVATKIKGDTAGVGTFQVEFDNAARFISATATDSKGNTSEFSMVDTDADGLADAWETLGIDVNEDGIPDVVLGSDPRHKDVFVEVDAMEDRAPAAGVLDAVVAAFAQAPNASVHNPDGKDGVTLHIGPIHDNKLPRAPFGPTDWDDFDKLKNTWFGDPAERKSANWDNIKAAKRLAYRYAIIADTHTDGSSGTAEIAGNDFYVTLSLYDKAGKYIAPTDKEMQGTFMHELGHTLGLRHGGGDDVNYKPNYRSVMNYTWQYPFILPAGATKEQKAFHDSWVLDYSREVLPDLNEKALNEKAGIGGRVGAMVGLGPARTPIVPENGPVDWNGKNGNMEAAVAADINGDGKLTVLTGFNDWANLQYYFVEERSFPDNKHGAPYDGEGRGCGCSLCRAATALIHSLEQPQVLLPDGKPIGPEASQTTHLASSSQAKSGADSLFVDSLAAPWFVLPGSPLVVGLSIPSQPQKYETPLPTLAPDAVHRYGSAIPDAFDNLDAVFSSDEPMTGARPWSSPWEEQVEPFVWPVLH